MVNINRAPKVKIVKVGTITQEASEIPSVINLQLKAELGIGGGSTVTLIQGDKNILVDTGFEYEWINTSDNHEKNTENLIWGLKGQGLKPKDIDIVFITHWHKDHFGNLGVLKNARYIAAKPLVERLHPEGFNGVDDGEEIMDGVKAVFTPGHTIDHASLLVATVCGGIKARIAITGDAVISHSYFQTGRIWKNNADFFDADTARKSIKQLIEASDVIIPGHGVPFMTFKPEWQKEEKSV
jgi:glyoxylase-like metal-dependent hydrolase (beta-lactamase superfamily II)